VTVLWTPPPAPLVPAGNPLLDALAQEPVARGVEPLPDLPPEPAPPARLPDREPRPEQSLPPAPPEKPKPEPPPPPAPPEKPEKPERPPEEKPPARLSQPPLPEANPQAENARLVELGRVAFAAGEYGRAAEQFRRAAAADRREPLAHFLLAQALLALGKYADAADAVHAGLAVQPDWPGAPFRPLELYGDRVADYAEHLHRLDAVVRQHPNDATLLFLGAYALWLDGRRDEARERFARARRAGADPGDVDCFLRFFPDAPPL
jgi:hypothetical protein